MRASTVAMVKCNRGEAGKIDLWEMGKLAMISSQTYIVYALVEDVS